MPSVKPLRATPSRATGWRSPPARQDPVHPQCRLGPAIRSDNADGCFALRDLAELTIELATSEPLREQSSPAIAVASVCRNHYWRRRGPRNPADHVAQHSRGPGSGPTLASACVESRPYRCLTWQLCCSPPSSAAASMHSTARGVRPRPRRRLRCRWFIHQRPSTEPPPEHDAGGASQR